MKEDDDKYELKKALTELEKNQQQSDQFLEELHKLMNKIK